MRCKQYIAFYIVTFVIFYNTPIYFPSSKSERLGGIRRLTLLFRSVF